MMQYIIFLLILIVPAIIVDDVIGSLESTGLRYLLRIVWFTLVFFVLSLIPKPPKS